MSKYQVGDKVVVRPDLTSGRQYGDDCATSSMISLAGKAVTIKDVTYGKYHIQESSYNWTDEMFVQKIADAPSFTKKDLKPGYVVILRSGKEFIVQNAGSAGDVPYLAHPSGSGESLSSFKDDLTCMCSANNDIVKVFGCSGSAMDILTTRTGNRKLLWERKAPVVELTMDQIAKLAGVDVSNLKIIKK